MQRLIRFFAVILFGVLCIGISSIAEEITLTTYYPAPWGEYEALRANRLAVGVGDMPGDDGYLNVNGTVTAGTIDAAAYKLDGVQAYSGDLIDENGLKIADVDNGLIVRVVYE